MCGRLASLRDALGLRRSMPHCAALARPPEQTVEGTVADVERRRAELDIGHIDKFFEPVHDRSMLVHGCVSGGTDVRDATAVPGSLRALGRRSLLDLTSSVPSVSAPSLLARERE